MHGIGDRLAIDQGLIGLEVLPARNQEGLHHHPDDRSVAGGDLIGDLADHARLALVVLAAVVVGGIDHDPLGEAGGAQLFRGVSLTKSGP
jgi:hypothetical protein